MAQIYLTQQDDELDDICHRFYGYSSGAVEAVLALEANRDLSLQLPVLPAGVSITLPTLALQPPASRPKLWG
jgi:phage tail protein X